MAALLLAATVARAQYYSWGADAASLRWRTIRTPDVQVIFPDTAGAIARRTLHFIEAARPSIGYGFRHGPLKIPFVMHPENFRSNGLVMWLPKRVEFLTSPAIDSYSMPWYKQLVAHEYRHAVQYNNLNRGVIKGLSYVLGQQGSTVGLLLLPIWLIEGDAVQMETQMSSFGRALQPSFTMEYRALGDAVRSRRNIDRWFCGSYRTNVPDHYHLGYQIAAYADTRYRENIWDKVAWYGARNPYMIFTTSIALKKFYRTDVGTLFAETFDGLNYYWNALPARRNSSRYLSAEPVESYTTYAFPLAIDAQRVLALKTDYDRPTRFVTIDTESGRERAVAYTGSVSTRPAYADGRVWWTEYRRSTLFEQRVNSQLCYMDLDRGKPKAVRGRRHALYPTPTDRGLAWVEYSPDGRFAVTGEAGVQHWEAPAQTELHGLAWDDRTARLYFLATDDSGMWLGRIEPDGTATHLTEGAYITLSDLTARDGRLYFGSIASGYDEVHCYDLATGRQYRLSTSTYGSFSPSADGEGNVLMTTYDAEGYHAARQPIDTLRPVRPSRLPRNVVNPPRRKWPVANLDTVRFTAADSVSSAARHRARRYSRPLHLFKVHSWMPVAVNPFKIIDEHDIDVQLGVTLISQNLLSSAESYLAYAWNHAEGSVVKGSLRYNGLGVELEVAGTYGGNQVIYAAGQAQPQPIPDKYYSLSAGATLPLHPHAEPHGRMELFERAGGQRRETHLRRGDAQLHQSPAHRLPRRAAQAHLRHRLFELRAARPPRLHNTARLRAERFLCAQPHQRPFQRPYLGLRQALHAGLRAAQLADGGRHLPDLDRRVQKPGGRVVPFLQVGTADPARLRLERHQQPQLLRRVARLPAARVVSRRGHPLGALLQAHPAEPRRRLRAVRRLRLPERTYRDAAHPLLRRRPLRRLQRFPPARVGHLDAAAVVLRAEQGRSVVVGLAGTAVLTEPKPNRT